MGVRAARPYTHNPSEPFRRAIVLGWRPFRLRAPLAEFPLCAIAAVEDELFVGIEVRLPAISIVG